MDIYLDNSATTKVREEVLNSIIYAYKNLYGNPSSLHTLGIQAEKEIYNVRKIISSFINSKPEEIFFTGGGTESNNLAILGNLKIVKKGDNIITTKIEHPSVYNVYKFIENKGVNVNYLDVNNEGYIDVMQLENFIDDKTKLVSIIMVNNEIGTLQNIKKIAKLIKSKNNRTKIHVDGVQAFGKIKIDVKELGIDTLSFSSHKLHGPKGIGGFYLNSKTKIEPIFYGGNQEKGIRSGTENTSGIIGFGKAVELISKEFDNENKKLYNLKNELAKQIKENIEDVKINSSLGSDGAPHILSVSFNNIKGEVLVHYLEKYGIYVSTGSACSSKRKKTNRILSAIKLNDKYIEGTIRFSFGYYNNVEEVDYVVEKLKESVQDIRKIIMR